MKQDQYHLSLIHARYLIDKPLHPPDFVVDTLLPQGLHILAGLPKVGKSWLALWLAVTVAKGEPLWNMRTRPGEYQARLRDDSWKLDLIQAINEALEYADSRESFIENMEQEGYEVVWTPTRKHITFVCPNGRRCRDSSLHDETFLKENLEALFAYRQAVGFYPGTEEPEIGWMGELAGDLLRLGKSLEQAADQPPLPTPPTWTDSKQRRREALKKLAAGQKLSAEQNYTMSM